MSDEELLREWKLGKLTVKEASDEDRSKLCLILDEEISDDRRRVESLIEGILLHALDILEGSKRCSDVGPIAESAYLKASLANFCDELERKKKQLTCVRPG